MVQSLSLVCNMSWREFVEVDDEPVLDSWLLSKLRYPALLYLLYLQLRLQETVEERSQALHLLRVVVTVDGLQLQPDEGFVGVARPALEDSQL